MPLRQDQGCLLLSWRALEENWAVVASGCCAHAHTGSAISLCPSESKGSRQELGQHPGAERPCAWGREPVEGWGRQPGLGNTVLISTWC